MLSFAEAADRLVNDDIAQSMTAEGLRKLARDPASGWPIGPEDYRVVGKTRTLPYELLVPYMQARRRGRGPDKTKQRAAPVKRDGRTQKQQGEPVTTTVDARSALYAFAMQGKEHSPANSERASEKIDAFRSAAIREAADAVAQLIEDGEHDPDCLVDELRSLASRPTPEPSDG